MERYSTKLVFICIAIAIIICGCASSPKFRTGFLSDYSKLQTNPDFEGSLIYINPELPLKNYSKFIISPVQIHLYKKAEERGVERSKLQELANYIHTQISLELKKSGYKIVQGSGPGTMTLRLALTDVNPAKTAFDSRPGSTFQRGSRSFWVTPVPMAALLGGASAEAEFIDSLTGKVILAAVETQKGERGFDGLTKYGNTENVIERWAKRLAIRMDKEHGKTRKE